jgi:hypothetical protein
MGHNDHWGGGEGGHVCQGCLQMWMVASGAMAHMRRVCSSANGGAFLQGLTLSLSCARAYPDCPGWFECGVRTRAAD